MTLGIPWGCMKDVLYIAVALAFFAACWYLTRACEKL